MYLLYHYPFVIITLLPVCSQSTFSLPIPDRDTSTLLYLTSRVTSAACLWATRIPAYHKVWISVGIWHTRLTLPFHLLWLLFSFHNRQQHTKAEGLWFPEVVLCRLATPFHCHRVRASLTIIVAELRREWQETDRHGRRPAPGRVEAREAATRETWERREIRSAGAPSTQWGPRLPRRFLYLLSLLARACRGQRRGHATPVMATAGPLPSFQWTTCCLLPAITIHSAMSAAPEDRV